MWKKHPLIIPGDLNALVAAIHDAGQEFGPHPIYRGQRNAMWEIESSFSRGVSESTQELMQNPSTRGEGRSYYIASKSFLNYFSSMKPSEEVIKKLNGQGCPYFEISRHHQQNFLKSKIHGIKDADLSGSPVIDFTFSPWTALFFANFEVNYKTEGLQPKLKESRSTDAAVYIVNYQAFEIYRTIPEIIVNYKLSNIENRDFKKPCIISPLSQINDENDQKPKRQQAVYVLQIDFRYSLDEALSIIEQETRKKMYCKIVVKKELFEECKKFLFSMNLSLDYLFPQKLHYQMARIQNVFKIYALRTS